MGVNYKGAITEFNPYVAQIPTEAYVKVGMYKQQQEEAGIQKIQGTIDNIAGLDVANEGGKIYLQSRVNELTSTLNKVGNIDMSNANNIRGLQGIAAPIYQDMNIQTDVANTMNYRSLVKDQQDALKNGKAESFSVLYETQKKVQPWLNSKMAGERYDGGSRTLRGTKDEARKMYLDEMAKFKPDKYKTQSSANPIFQVQTETGLESMNKTRLSEYVLGTMSGDTRELLKRDSWSENSTISDPALVEKIMQSASAKTAGMLVDAEQFSNLAKIHSNNSEMSAQYQQMSDERKKSHDAYIDAIKAQLAQLDPNKLTEQQKEMMYSELGTSKFAMSLAEGIAYTDTDTKQLMNPVWAKVYGEDNENLRNAVTSKNINVAPRLDAEGRVVGLGYSDNPYKHATTTIDKDGNVVGGGVNGEKYDKNGVPLVTETNVPTPAKEGDVTKWTYPTYDKITDNFKNAERGISAGIYTFLKAANIDADKYFVTSYEKNPDGTIGQITKTSIKKGFEKEVNQLVTALETAVDAELTDATLTTKLENSLKTGEPSGNPGLTKELNALSPEMRGKFMPALKYVTEDKSGKGYLKEVLEQKKKYANNRAALANVMRKYGETVHGFNPGDLAKFKSLNDDQLLDYKNESETTGDKAAYTRIDIGPDGKKYINTVSVDAQTGKFSPSGDQNTVLATEDDAKNYGYKSLNEIKNSSHLIRIATNSHTFFDKKFTKKFDEYLQDNVSARTENVYSTVFNNMLGTVGTAEKESLVKAVLSSQNIPVTDETLKSANFSIAGFSNTNESNPLEKKPKIKLSYTKRGNDNKPVALSLEIDINPFLAANPSPSHPFQKVFSLNKYMEEATTIMMDPYHGSRLNDSVKDWNIISDNKANKAMKYRVIWTGHDVENGPREVGLNVKQSGINEADKAYIEMYVPGKGKVLLKDPKTGNPVSYSHPAQALEFLHNTFERSSEADLDKFYEYLSK